MTLGNADEWTPDLDHTLLQVRAEIPAYGASKPNWAAVAHEFRERTGHYAHAESLHRRWAKVIKMLEADLRLTRIRAVVIERDRQRTLGTILTG